MNKIFSIKEMHNDRFLYSNVNFQKLLNVYIFCYNKIKIKMETNVRNPGLIKIFKKRFFVDVLNILNMF